MRPAGDDVRLGLVVDSQRAADRVLVDQATAQESARFGAWLPEVPGEPVYFFFDKYQVFRKTANTRALGICIHRRS